MGLDMYLTGEKFLSTDWEHPENNPTEDGFRVKQRELELGYWRKHADLHGYIVNAFARGVDECQRIELSEQNLKQIIDAVQGRILPHTEGFFFGSSDLTDEEIENDVKVLQGAIDWLLNDNLGGWRSVIYQASW